MEPIKLIELTKSKELIDFMEQMKRLQEHQDKWVQENIGISQERLGSPAPRPYINTDPSKQ